MRVQSTLNAYTLAVPSQKKILAYEDRDHHICEQNSEECSLVSFHETNHYSASSVITITSVNRCSVLPSSCFGSNQCRVPRHAIHLLNAIQSLSFFLT